jgi:hypothetical protein
MAPTALNRKARRAPRLRRPVRILALVPQRTTGGRNSKSSRRRTAEQGGNVGQPRSGDPVAGTRAASAAGRKTYPAGRVLGSCAVNRLCVLLVLTGVSTSAAAAPEWQVDVPAGWSPNPELEKQLLAARDVPNMKTELHVWMSPDRREMLAVEWHLADPKHRSDDDVIAMLDASPFDEFRNSTRVERRQKIVDSQVMRDASGTASGMRFRRIRRYQRTSNGIHALILTCTAPTPSPCEAAVERARFVPTSAPAGAGDAPDPGSAAGASDDARPWRFRIGLVLGMAGVVALVIALLTWRHQRRPRRVL